MNTKIRRAVSLVFVCKSKVYIIKRQNFLNFFPGYTAFPGGKVDKKDLETDDPLFSAAVREAHEELGIDLNDLIQNKKILKYRKWAHATTPDFNPYRFDTTFFLFECKVKLDFDIDENEVAEAAWISPYDIIRKFNSGECLIVKPIRDLLEQLSFKKNPDTFIEFDQAPGSDIPTIEPIKDLIQIMPRSDTLPPADRTNCFVVGDSLKLVMDPSPKDTEEYRKLIAILEKYQIDKVFISHHHGDHHQYAPQIAMHFQVPIFISRDSYERIKKIQGEKYFHNCKVELIQDGDVIGRWMGQEIKAYAVPGHDQGHMAIAPTNMNWFIVGDLFQGVGTVVIGGNEGNMSDYFKSLKKVIDFKPNCVIPSHGIALGGTNILEKTLAHRQEREKQVMELYNKEMDIDQIVKTLYFDIPRSLHLYAKANIKSHLDKLKAEKKV